MASPRLARNHARAGVAMMRSPRCPGRITRTRGLADILPPVSGAPVFEGSMVWPDGRIEMRRNRARADDLARVPGSWLATSSARTGGQNDSHAASVPGGSPGGVLPRPGLSGGTVVMMSWRSRCAPPRRTLLRRASFGPTHYSRISGIACRANGRHLHWGATTDPGHVNSDKDRGDEVDPWVPSQGDTHSLREMQY